MRTNECDSGTVSKRLAHLDDLSAEKCKINLINEDHAFVFSSYYIMESKAMFCER